MDWRKPNKMEQIRRKANGETPYGLELRDAVQMWPTPTVDDAHNATRESGAFQSLTRSAGGQLNPTWVEWLMGYPLGYTEVE